MTTNAADVSSHYVRKWLGEHIEPPLLAHILLRLCEKRLGSPQASRSLDRAIRDVQKVLEGAPIGATPEL